LQSLVIFVGRSMILDQTLHCDLVSFLNIMMLRSQAASINILMPVLGKGNGS
jgi:anaerobic C4-dicarboxylate transporter